MEDFELVKAILAHFIPIKASYIYLLLSGLVDVNCCKTTRKIQDNEILNFIGWSC
jgi:hypothetical protein